MGKREDKLNELLEMEGLPVPFDPNDEETGRIMLDSVNPGICMNDWCNYTTEIEPDSSEGYCENCETNTVKSLTELALF